MSFLKTPLVTLGADLVTTLGADLLTTLGADLVTMLGADLIKRPFWIMTSFMLIFLGMQFISMGLLAEIQIRTYHESQGRPTYVI